VGIVLAEPARPRLTPGGSPVAGRAWRGEALNTGALGTLAQTRRVDSVLPVRGLLRNGLRDAFQAYEVIGSG